MELPWRVYLSQAVCVVLSLCRIWILLFDRVGYFDNSVIHGFISTTNLKTIIMNLQIKLAIKARLNQDELSVLYQSSPLQAPAGQIKILRAPINAAANNNFLSPNYN